MLVSPAAYSPVTFGCVEAICTVPCGAWSAATHRPTLCSVRAKSPAAWLCCDGCDHCTCTHGCGVAGGSVKGQPATVNVAEERSTKSPPAFTRVLDVGGDTGPPCGPIITLVPLESPATGRVPPISHAGAALRLSPA